MAFDPKQAGAAVNENMAASMQGLTAASKAMQTLTNEMVSMSMDSLRQTSKAFEQMQGARTFADVLRIQQEFFKGAFEDFASRSRRMAELATQAPMGMAKQTEKVMERAGEQTKGAISAVTDDAKAATAGLDMAVPSKPAN